MKHIMSVILSIICMNCGFLVDDVPELKDYSPLPGNVDLESSLTFYTYNKDDVLLFDTQEGQLIQKYTFSSDFLVMDALADPDSDGFYVSLSHGSGAHIMAYVNYRSGKVFELDGFSQFGSCFAYTLSDGTVYVSGKKKGDNQLYARSVSMPEQQWGEIFPIPEDWLWQRKIADNGNNACFSLDKNGSGSQLFFMKEEVSLDFVYDYLNSGDESSGLFFLSENLINANFLFESEGQDYSNIFKVYKVNNLSPDISEFDAEIVFSMEDPFNRFFEKEDSFFVFSNGSGARKIRKFDKSWNLASGPVSLNENIYSLNVADTEVQEKGGFFYWVSADGGHILKIDQNLSIEKIQL